MNMNEIKKVLPFDVKSETLILFIKELTNFISLD
jgi:hypothetical protein